MSYLVSAPRTSELVMWLRCNDVDPHQVPSPSEIYVESDPEGVWWIRHSVYVLNDRGAVAYDSATRSFRYEDRWARLVSDPPMHWLTELAAS